MTFSNQNHKRERLSSLLEHLAAEFISRHTDQDALVTITGSRLSDSGEHIDLFISVMPESGENKALEILSRSKKDFSEYVEKRAKISRMPSFDFKIDRTLSKQFNILNDIERNEKEHGKPRRKE